MKKNTTLVLLLCAFIFFNLHADNKPNNFVGPHKEIPVHLYDSYTLANTIPVAYWFGDDSYSDNNPLIYTRSEINTNIIETQQKKTKYYGATDTYLYNAFEKYTVANKSVAILGSNVPWYEGIVLNYGGRPTTIEYNKIISEDARLTTMTVAEYNKNQQTFDAIISISSFEHDGLGRYGDPLDPNGDIKAMQKN